MKHSEQNLFSEDWLFLNEINFNLSGLKVLEVAFTITNIPNLQPLASNLISII